MRHNFWALPTWGITRIALRCHLLPAKHPWYGRRFTLANWSACQTPLCRQFDFILWVYFGLLSLLALQLLGGV